MTSSSLSHPLSCNYYDVFLSFRGTDTREGFTSHLYQALHRNGIYTFMDIQLRKGGEISMQLLEKIQQSKGSIVVFSENYASSPWCLDELLSIHGCRVNKNHQVLPIFYKVDPSDIRHQRGETGKYMAKHEQENRNTAEKVRQWKIALKDIANLVGCHFKPGMIESVFIEEIVQDVSRKLNRPRLSVAHYPVGLDEQVRSTLPALEIGSSNDVRMIGILGPKGIGKTTIAKALYNLHADKFEGSSFLADVQQSARKHNLLRVQKKLLLDILQVQDDSISLGSVDRGIVVIRERLRCKKILLVIDGVDDIEQLWKLAGEAEWFGSGSRIIITAEDSQVLKSHGVKKFYEMKKLSDIHSSHLFCWYAFKTLSPPNNNFAQLSSRILGYIQGIPLGIITMGSHLYGRGIEEWRIELARLEDTPFDQVCDEIIRICYHGLNALQKTCFLTISCFLDGKDKDEVAKMLDEFEPGLGSCMGDLTSTCMVTIEENIVRVHDLARVMARIMVRAVLVIDSRLGDMLDGLEEATDDIGSVVHSIYLEILEDSDTDEEGDEIDKLVDNIERGAHSPFYEEKEAAGKLIDDFESAMGEIFEDSEKEEEDAIDELIDDVKSAAQSIFSFFS